MPTIADYPDKTNRRTVNVPTSGIVTVEPSDPYWEDTSEPPYVPAPSGRLPTVTDGDGDTLVFEDAWLELIVYTDDTEEFLGTTHPFARPAWLTTAIQQAIDLSGQTDALLQLTLNSANFHDDLKVYVIKVVVNDGVNGPQEAFFKLFPVGQGLGVELIVVADGSELWYSNYLETPVLMFDDADMDQGMGVVYNGLLYVLREQGGNAKIMTIPANTAGAPYADGDFTEVYDFGTAITTNNHSVMDVNYGKIAILLNGGTGSQQWWIMNIDGSGAVEQTGAGHTPTTGMKLINSSEVIYGSGSNLKRRNMATNTETATKAAGSIYGTAVDIEGDRVFVCTRSSGTLDYYSLDFATGPTTVLDVGGLAEVSSDNFYPRHYQADTDLLYLIAFNGSSEYVLFSVNVTDLTFTEVLNITTSMGIPETFAGAGISVQIEGG